MNILGSNKEMHSQARRYYVSSQILLSCATPENANSIAAPAMHLSLISTEIFLKLFCFQNNPNSSPPRTHDLKKLFMQLPASTRQKIKKEFKPDFDKLILAHKRMDLLPDDNKIIIPNSLVHALELTTKMYEPYRYSWEFDLSESCDILNSFPKALDNVLLEMFKEFRTSGPLFVVHQ